MNFLPDVNFWFALTVGNHEHHAAAVSQFDQMSAKGTVFCRATQTGLLRLLTTAAAMSSQPLSMADAWRVYDELRSDERVVFLGEPDGVEVDWKRHSLLKFSSPKRWMDAYLAAFAQGHGLRLLTFDRTLATLAGGDGLP